MIRIYNLLIFHGFKVERFTGDSLEAYVKNKKGKKKLTLIIIKERDAKYITKWCPRKDDDYELVGYKQQFIFRELEKYGFYS